jgi:hypothetical protein
MMATTIKSSMSEKPDCLGLRVITGCLFSSSR